MFSAISWYCVIQDWIYICFVLLSISLLPALNIDISVDYIIISFNNRFEKIITEQWTELMMPYHEKTLGDNV